MTFFLNSIKFLYTFFLRAIKNIEIFTGRACAGTQTETLNARALKVMDDVVRTFGSITW